MTAMKAQRDVTQVKDLTGIVRRLGRGGRRVSKRLKLTELKDTIKRYNMRKIPHKSNS
jgi:hypothetical protein